MKKLLATLLLAATSLSASAYTDAWASTLGNLRYTVSFPSHPLATCNTLLLDVTGDFENSSRWSAYGALNCKDGSGYTVAGAAYLGANNHIYLTAGVGLYARMNCDITAKTCRLYEPTNNSVYTGTIK